MKIVSRERRARLADVAPLFLLALSACGPYLSSQPPMPEQGLILPRYHPMLQAANVGGTVEIELPVSAEGVPSPRPSRVIESTHELFLSSLVRAVSRWRFTPAIRHGRAAPDTVAIRFTFLLDSSARCGPAEIIWSGGPRPALPPVPEPRVTFDPSTLRGTVTACRTPAMKAIVGSTVNESVP